MTNTWKENAVFRLNCHTFVTGTATITTTISPLLATHCITHKCNKNHKCNTNRNLMRVKHRPSLYLILSFVPSKLIEVNLLDRLKRLIVSKSQFGRQFGLTLRAPCVNHFSSGQYICCSSLVLGQLHVQCHNLADSFKSSS